MLGVLLAAILGVAAGAAVASGLLRLRRRSDEAAAASEADAVRVAASDADRVVRQARLEAEEEGLRTRRALEEEARAAEEARAREDGRLRAERGRIAAADADLERRRLAVEAREEEVAGELEAARRAHAERLGELERVGGLTAEEARREVLGQAEEEARAAAELLARRMEAEARQTAEARARDIVVTAIQRTAASHAGESTVTVVALASDDLKGRIIGREGRNIRALEHLTGVDLIIDDTPQTVVLSSFDGVRREVARVTLEHLLADGRIHPTSIEEAYYEAKAKVADVIERIGRDAAVEGGVPGLDAEIVRMLGRLRFRTSYGQNVLQHLLECTHLAALMAAELGADERVASRAALLHDLGKAMDQEAEASHALAGAEFCRRHGESEAVCHAIAAHHNEVAPVTVEAVLVQAADAISAARPGARGEALEAYLRRMHALEEIAAAKPGVDRVYAVQAGREVRVIVRPADVDDAASARLSSEIARQIERELDYPGTVRVTVIRESRAIDVAR
jgi:ribonuclease Y